MYVQFNVELDETDALRDDYQVWKTCDVSNNRPPPMIIEVYIDPEELTNNQSLVVQDEYGKQWSVEDAMRSYIESNSSTHSRSSDTKLQVILERWHIELGPSTSEMPNDLGNVLPRVYKNSIVLFRSLYTYTKLLPTWKLSKRLSKPRHGQTLPKLKYRFYDGQRPDHESADSLFIPLLEGQRETTVEYNFEPIDSPAGPFAIKLTYRKNCDFRIEHSEAMLSSHFMDEDMFRPSLGNPTSVYGRGGNEPVSRKPEVGSLPPARRNLAEVAEQSQAYGSLSTFHNVAGPRISASPLSALRAARDFGYQSPTDPPIKSPPDARTTQGSRSSLRSEVAPSMGRRTSVSFMPFKSPSLAASPSQGDQYLASPRGSIGRTSTLGALAEARNPTLAPQTAPSRASPVVPEGVPSSACSSPRPTVPRYSSSFGHRRARLSVGGSKTEDDNSSGKASLTSSNAQPGSGVLNEGGNASSGSINADDDNISDFLKMLDQKKDLSSFNAAPEATTPDAPTRRTTAALSKFQLLRESNAVLSDSMSTSFVQQAWSGSSSRQLSSVPPMVAGTSGSISSSPGERMSPRTPHTPAIPSRLSANSIIEYNNRERGTGRHRLSEGEYARIQEQEESSTAQNRGTGAIDIPTSPRPFHPRTNRRSSSVAQQHRALALPDDLNELPYGMRSASLGDGEEREPLTLSALLGAQDNVAGPILTGHPHVPITDAGGIDMGRQHSAGSHDGRDDGSTRGVPYRPRLGGRGSGRAYTTPHGSNISLAGERGSGSASSDQRGGRYSSPRPSANFEDEEPLLFAMSDFGTGQGQGPHSRRSVEEATRGSGAGLGETGSMEGNVRRGSRRGGAGGHWS